MTFAPPSFASFPGKENAAGMRAIGGFQRALDMRTHTDNVVDILQIASAEKIAPTLGAAQKACSNSWRRNLIETEVTTGSRALS